jgi:cysteine desulfurase/selenocysteine lyase
MISEFNSNKIRKEFPILQRNVHPNTPLIYLDSAATSQKPTHVIDVIAEFYSTYNANIHRGIHKLAEEATFEYENSRKKIAAFIGASKTSEVIFTRNTTESINLIAYSWARKKLKENDLILLTEMEHHANIVPWQILASEKNIQIQYIPVNEDFLLDLEIYKQYLNQNPKLVSFTHMSNVLGTINPAKEIINLAHQVGAITIVDGAQAVLHFSVNVKDLDADFYAFSGHKMLGPTGIGVLYGKEELLEEMPPFLGGGDMIKKVTFEGFSCNALPHKFEAGTPAVAEAVGLGAAVDYLNQLTMDTVFAHEKELTEYGYTLLSSIPHLSLFGPKPEHKGGVLSFTYADIHPHDIAETLDQIGIAVRAGHHCAMPLHLKYDIPATTRASFYIYNTKEEIDQLAANLEKVYKIYG